MTVPDHDVVPKFVLRLEVPSDDGHHHIAVGRYAVFVDGDQPVGVTVEAEADPARRQTSEVLGMCGAAPLVDVRSVREVAVNLHLRLEPTKQFGRHLVGGTVGGVEDDLQ